MYTLLTIIIYIYIYTVCMYIYMSVDLTMFVQVYLKSLTLAFSLSGSRAKQRLASRDGSFSDSKIIFERLASKCVGCMPNQ
jgi:hypothetical protein